MGGLLGPAPWGAGGEGLRARLTRPVSPATVAT